MNADEIFTYTASGVLFAFGALGVALFLAPKNIDYYYLSKQNEINSSSVATCVYAHWTFHSDEQVYCTNNADDAIKFLDAANARLPKRDK